MVDKASYLIGGGLLLSLWAPTAANPVSVRSGRQCLPPWTQTYSANISYVGCFTDNSDRVLQGGQANYLSGGTTPQTCGEACGLAGFSYAGVEDGRFGSASIRSDLVQADEVLANVSAGTQLQVQPRKKPTAHAPFRVTATPRRCVEATGGKFPLYILPCALVANLSGQDQYLSNRKSIVESRAFDCRRFSRLHSRSTLQQSHLRHVSEPGRAR